MCAEVPTGEVLLVATGEEESCQDPQGRPMQIHNTKPHYCLF